MKLLGPLSRVIVLAGVLVTAAAMPALAGPAEMALLSQYAGTWTGKGTLSGAQTQPVNCKIEFSASRNGKLGYTGRCILASAQLSVYGTIAYVDDSHRYEAVMTSGIGGFNGVAVGQKVGDNIVFNLKQRANDDAGNDISMESSVTLHDHKIDVAFHATFNSNGQSIDTKIPFTM